MSHVITRACCNDASCVVVCPVNCIHPTPDEPDFATAEMLHIDPAVCIDCGACVDECPVDAITPDDLLPVDSLYPEINAGYYRDREVDRTWSPPRPAAAYRGPAPLEVAIVGAGPAAFYTAGELLRHNNVRVDLFERLPTPYGLVRAGVAPDHAATKGVERTFAATAAHDDFRYFLNVTVGRDVTVDELRARYGAVVIACGAAHDRRLGIPGEDLAGSLSVTDFVAWYNGHPDHADDVVDLSGHDVIIIGNGNVALDAARILLTDPEELARTDIADHALATLRSSRVRTVTIVGRRGPAHAAYSNSEFDAFGSLSGVDVVIDPADLVLDTATRRAEQSGTLDATTTMKLRLARQYATRTPTGASRRAVFRYFLAPASLDGGPSRVQSVTARRTAYTPHDPATVEPTGEDIILPADTVIRSVGYRAHPLAGLPFDDVRAVIPNRRGRVIHDGAPVPGVYTAGWIKRGATGGIGANRRCGIETAEAVLTDWSNGALPPPAAMRDDLPTLITRRGGRPIAAPGWAAIDAHERAAGRRQGRRRRKLTSIEQMVSIADSPAGS
ncbi:ferredoxin [Mycolicibacterium sp. 018/SC-01/001]|uniref:FAD-dependent oxidoreductase n=1 Tax=Mycolicibacterium sp. 018/SC-01/001 TaxID=2592069 RepID=UPI00117FB88F|nr:FAD-dependent oxidoreductase [Mycolicibacterium sp. 018/SC-01/001]TRW79651.1 ferredoxin [Mycolicibacterium sp. 018/SC-01/001]